MPCPNTRSHPCVPFFLRRWTGPRHASDTPTADVDANILNCHPWWTAATPRRSSACACVCACFAILDPLTCGVPDCTATWRSYFSRADLPSLRRPRSHFNYPGEVCLLACWPPLILGVGRLVAAYRFAEQVSDVGINLCVLRALVCLHAVGQRAMGLGS